MVGAVSIRFGIFLLSLLLLCFGWRDWNQETVKHAADPDPLLVTWFDYRKHCVSYSSVNELSNGQSDLSDNFFQFQILSLLIQLGTIIRSFGKKNEMNGTVRSDFFHTGIVEEFLEAFSNLEWNVES